MLDSPTEYLPLLRRSLQQTESVLREADDPGRRDAGVAAALRTLCPFAPLLACRLRRPGGSPRTIDQQGAQRPDWLPPLENFLSRYETAHPSPRQLVPLPSEVPLAGQSLAVQPIACADLAWGVLLVAVPAGMSSATTGLLWELLETFSCGLASQLQLAADRGEATRLRQALAEQTELADLAALASPVTHEFNNFLNTLILQLMVLANQVPEQFRADLRGIGQQAKAVAGLVRQWQQHRAQHRAAPRRLDVNELVREAAARLTQATAESATPLVLDRTGAPANAVHLSLAPAADLPLVEGMPLDLLLVLRLLIRNAAATITAASGTVIVSTRREADSVVIAIEDTGPPISPALLPRMFEPTAETREGTSQLEMAACEALVQRRLRGRIHGENRAGGGVTILVRLRPV